MDYETARKNEIRKSFDRQIENFVRNDFCAAKPSIIFIPGSPGSRLNRSTSSYGEPGAEYDYAPAWVSMGLVPLPFLKKAGTAYDLRIDPDGQDAQGHFIVPDGTLHFVLSQKVNSRFLFNNYAKAKKKFEKRYNYFEFGCDFRRPVDETANWLHYVLNRLRMRVFREHDARLDNLNILCHSFGGVIGKVFFDLYPAMERVVNKFVTLGTPFFGSPNHFDYLYRGDPKVNRFYTPELIASIYASFPGPYPSTYLSVEAFRTLRRSVDVVHYPVHDRQSGKEISPYEKGALGRYPGFVRSASREPYAHVRNALRIQKSVASEMPEAISEKTFHLLCDSVEMPAYYLWDDIDGKSFRLNGEDSPLRPSDETCMGDGSVHHWSSCLPQVLCSSGPSRVYRCQTETSHYKMLQSDEILATVEHLIDYGTLPVAEAVRPRIASFAPGAEGFSFAGWVEKLLVAGRTG